MLTAVLLFSLMDAGLKALSEHYPPLQVSVIRSASSLPLVSAWALWTVGLRPLFRVRWSLHLFRGATGIAMMTSFAYSLRVMPMSAVYSIFFVAPIMITALSIPLLGERVDARRWAAIVAGMIGVLVVLGPGGKALMSLAGIAVLIAALAYAVSAITVRILSRTESTQALMIWLLVFMTLGSGALAAPGWVSIRASDAWVIVGIGAAGAAGQYAMVEAFRLGEASLIAPLEYTALVWGILLDITVWGVLPDSITWLGAAIVSASGLYLLRHEHVGVQRECS
jgi:drug/metabolite transporter (DMT)-like permease